MHDPVVLLLWKGAAGACGRFEDAVGHFSRSIALDKTCEVYYSNRSAALAALKRFHEALGDARAVVRLKPRWAKGWARLGAAHMGLEDFGEVGCALQACMVQQACYCQCDMAAWVAFEHAHVKACLHLCIVICLKISQDRCSSAF